MLTTNLTSMFLCCQAAPKPMVPARYGKIVNLSSRSALGNRGQVNYAAAKAGVQGLTATLAIELGPYNINVNAVAPGYIATPMTAATAERVGSTPEEHQELVAERTPLRRVGQPEEVAVGDRLPGQRRGLLRQRPDPVRQRRRPLAAPATTSTTRRTEHRGLLTQR